MERAQDDLDRGHDRCGTSGDEAHVVKAAASRGTPKKGGRVRGPAPVKAAAGRLAWRDNGFDFFVAGVDNEPTL
jgi:hypothetical protein